MRIILSAPTVHPLTWSCTKIENLKPIGIQDLTLYQNQFSSLIEHDHTNVASLQFSVISVISDF